MADDEQLKILQTGVEAWNQWRADHRLSKVDLSNADLTGANLVGAILNEAKLRGAKGIRFNVVELITEREVAAHLTDLKLPVVCIGMRPSPLVDPTDPGDRDRTNLAAKGWLIRESGWGPVGLAERCAPR